MTPANRTAGSAMSLPARGVSCLVSVLLLLAAWGCLASAAPLVFPLSRRLTALGAHPNARELLASARLDISGSVRGLGYYYATIHLGTPPQKFQVIVDTGSTITYVPCSACTNCGSNHWDEKFNPAASTTYEAVSCKSQQCRASAGKCPAADQRSEECTYWRHYAEESSSSGLLVSDMLAVGGPIGEVRILFGCETAETGDIHDQLADGIMGLGVGDISVVNQLREAGVMEDVFSLCYGGFEGGGAIIFGDDLPVGTSDVIYTPLVQNAQHPSYYTLRTVGMGVEGEALSLPSYTFLQSYGTVLDSGTTFIYIPAPAFEAIVNRLKQVIQLPAVDGPDASYEDICFGNAGEDERMLGSVFPTLYMEFDGNARLELFPVNYLFKHSVTPGAYCLGIFNNFGDGTLIGGIAVRDKLIIYDRRNSRIGFTAADCGSLAPLSSTVPSPPPAPGPPPPSPPALLPPTPSTSSDAGVQPPAVSPTTNATGDAFPPASAPPCNGCATQVLVHMKLSMPLEAFTQRLETFRSNVARELQLSPSQIQLLAYDDNVDVSYMITAERAGDLLDATTTDRIVQGLQKLQLDSQFGSYHVESVRTVSPFEELRPKDKVVGVSAVVLAALLGLVLGAVLVVAGLLGHRYYVKRASSQQRGDFSQVATNEEAEDGLIEMNKVPV
eukprot:jgi/Chlat1/8355/Chrsp80S07792